MTEYDTNAAKARISFVAVQQQPFPHKQ